MSRLLRERDLGDRRIQRKLEALRRAGCNFDPAGEHTPEQGWRIDDHSAALQSERPGVPEPAGAFAIARRLMWGYEFADPSLVKAFYDPREPLAGRTMLLELRFHGLLRFDCGTHVAAVYEEDREYLGRPARVWGWAYRTLEGHLEAGQMDWQVWKWPDTGEVRFRIHSFSRRAADRSPLIRLGFRLFGRREQLAFIESTLARMQVLTGAALQSAGREELVSRAEQLTARGGVETGADHARLAERLRI